MSTQTTTDFLLEIGTEELPPKSLNNLSQALCDHLTGLCEKNALCFGTVKIFATPRRLAVLIKDLAITQPDQTQQRKGPALTAAFDACGNPTKAAMGFARSCGVSIDELQRTETDKGAWLSYEIVQKGQSACELLPELVQQALKLLPIPKRMRWGAETFEFIRPVHWVVLMLGDQTVPASVMGCTASNVTFGHRFHANKPIRITSADQYEPLLFEQGKVMSCFETRKALIQSQVNSLAEKVNGQAVMPPALLNEVTALVEWPVPLMGQFEEHFLQVPKEALISTMQDNQKYFAVLDQNQALMPCFITIANIESTDPQTIIAGNEKVIRPRFSDAKFFFDQDRKKPLEHYNEALKNVIYQAGLGSLWDKACRVAQLAQSIASTLGFDPAQAQRAGLLCKADLACNMVLEFPELQGVMGYYYALASHEPAAVALAIKEHYLPSQADGPLPESDIGACVAIADKLDTLAGIFSLGQTPTGDKDPFALRRAALGIIRIMIAKQFSLDLKALIHAALQNFNSGAETENALLDFFQSRYLPFYQEQSIEADVVYSVIALKLHNPYDIDQRIRAVNAFRDTEAAKSLSAANKRVKNILKKSPVSEDISVSTELLQAPEEINLYQNLISITKTDSGYYHEALQQLSQLRDPVDTFFDSVMVMHEDEKIRNNRLALLARLQSVLQKVADISELNR